MRHEQYMRNKLAEDEEKLMDEHYTKQIHELIAKDYLNNVKNA